MRRRQRMPLRHRARRSDAPPAPQLAVGRCDPHRSRRAKDLARERRPRRAYRRRIGNDPCRSEAPPRPRYLARTGRGHRPQTNRPHRRKEAKAGTVMNESGKPNRPIGDEGSRRRNSCAASFSCTTSILKKQPRQASEPTKTQGPCAA